MRASILFYGIPGNKPVNSDERALLLGFLAQKRPCRRCAGRVGFALLVVRWSAVCLPWYPRTFARLWRVWGAAMHAGRGLKIHRLPSGF